MGPARARIIVRGRLSDRLASAFEGMTLVRHAGRTELVGKIADQAQLHGLLARIRDLGLELQHVSVTPEERGETTRKRGKGARHSSFKSTTDVAPDHTRTRHGPRIARPEPELALSGPRGTISDVTGRLASAEHLRDLARLRRVRDRIDREYARPLDVEALARGAHMSAGHFSREFRVAYGESPYSYVMTRRIERAMALLRRGDLSVTEVCFAVGCSSLGAFSTRFTELVGVSPSTYRRQAADATAGMPPCIAKRVTKPIRNREAPVAERT
jgi:AraC-like DNA-binding protein